MTQPAPPNRKNRKPPVFVRCPVWGTEFRNFSGQRWCSVDCARAARRHARAAATLQAPATGTGRIRKQAKHAAADAVRPELVRRVREP
jgi:hypothetical protein